MNVTFTQKGENNAYVLSFTNKESFQNMMTCILGMAERVIVEEHYNDFVELTSLLQGRYQPDDTTFVYTSEASDIIKKMMILSACGNSTMDEIMEYISELNSFVGQQEEIMKRQAENIEKQNEMIEQLNATVGKLLEQNEALSEKLCKITLGIAPTNLIS